MTILDEEELVASAVGFYPGSTGGEFGRSCLGQRVWHTDLPGSPWVEIVESTPLARSPMAGHTELTERKWDTGVPPVGARVSGAGPGEENEQDLPTSVPKTIPVSSSRACRFMLCTKPSRKGAMITCGSTLRILVVAASSATPSTGGRGLLPYGDHWACVLASKWSCQRAR